MEPLSISFESISPFVRYAEDVYIPYTKPQITVKTYDHRLFYIVNGNASVEINDSIREVGPGNVLYWMSGTSYLIRPKENTVLHIISINFDFLQQNSSTVQYLPMVLPHEYEREKQLEDLIFCDVSVLNSPVFVSKAPEMLPYLRTMLYEFETSEVFHQVQLTCLMRIVLTLLCRTASQRQPIKGSRNSYKTILDYINGHYAEDLTNKKLADLFNYNPNYISQLICEHTGVPLHQYLLKIRIHHALYLLQTTQLPINEIAQQVGFKNASYFSQYFKQRTGYPPSVFRVV